MEKDSSEAENKTEDIEKNVALTQEKEESKEQIPKKKKNKKKKPKKQEETQNNEGEKEVEEDPQKQYEKELQWCIDQIKTGMNSNRLDALQLKESRNVLNILESETAPLVKKRHLMSVVFGDYRKLMKNSKK